MEYVLLFPGLIFAVLLIALLFGGCIEGIWCLGHHRHHHHRH